MSKDSAGEAARRFLDEMDAAALREDAEQPHGVIAYDPYTPTLIPSPAHIQTGTVPPWRLSASGSI